MLFEVGEQFNAGFVSLLLLPLLKVDWLLFYFTSGDLLLASSCSNYSTILSIEKLANLFGKALMECF